MTNVFNNAIVSGILVSDVLDHLPVFYVSNDTTVTTNFTSAVKSYRHICEQIITLFRGKLINTQWQNNIESSDTDNSYEAFFNKFYVLYNNYFPLVF